MQQRDEKNAVIRRREVTLCPALRSDLQLNFEHWDDEKIHRYIDLFQSFGYNSIQLMEINAYCGGYQAAGFPDLESLAKNIVSIADYAASIGMETSFFIWAQILPDPDNPSNPSVLCPGKPGDRSVLEQEHERLARTYASHFDRIVVYWGEPGPCMKDCGQCDYTTYERMTTELLDKFNRYNSRIEAYLNIWGLLIPERAGRLANQTHEILKPKSLLEKIVSHELVIERLQTEGEVVDNRLRLGAMDRLACSEALRKDIGICIDGCTTGSLTWSGLSPLYLDELSVITRSGRTVGVWGWYLVDYEGTEKTDLELCRIEEYFKSIPVETAATLAWHSIDITNHGWPLVMINSYVACQLMINPTKLLDDILRDYCEGYFHPELAHAIKECLYVLDKAPLVFHPLPKVKILNLIGTKPFEEMAERCLIRAMRIDIDPSYQPCFPVVIDPATMRRIIIERLELAVAISNRLRLLHE